MDWGGCIWSGALVHTHVYMSDHVCMCVRVCTCVCTCANDTQRSPFLHIYLKRQLSKVDSEVESIIYSDFSMQKDSSAAK